MTTQEFVTSLFEVEVNTHVAHAQTKSYAEHKALQSVYEDLVDLRDRYIEGYQGKYGLIKGYKSVTLTEGIDPLPYLKKIVQEYEEFKATVTDGYLQQILDDILELLYSAIYKLKFLM